MAVLAAMCKFLLSNLWKYGTFQTNHATNKAVDDNQQCKLFPVFF